MKKEYKKIEYEHENPKSYNARMAMPQFDRMEEKRRIMYEWLNKTDAPEEVWKAYLDGRRTEVWVA